MEPIILTLYVEGSLHDEARDNGDGTFTHTLTLKQESAYVAGWRKIHSLSDLNWVTTSQCNPKHQWELTPCGRYCCQKCGKEETDVRRVQNWACDPPCQPKFTPTVHKWEWDGKNILCKDCGCGTIDSPKTCARPVTRKFCSICGCSFRSLEGDKCPACDKADDGYPWPGYFCTTCGGYYPKVLLNGNVCPACRIKTHDEGPHGTDSPSRMTDLYPILRHDIVRDSPSSFPYCANCGKEWKHGPVPRRAEHEICEDFHAEHSTQHGRREGTHP